MPRYLVHGTYSAQVNANSPAEALELVAQRNLVAVAKNYLVNIEIAPNHYGGPPTVFDCLGQQSTLDAIIAGHDHV